MDYEQLLSSLDPDTLQQLMQSGQSDDQLSILQDQLKQAQGLRQPTTKDYGTATGTALGGAGNVVRNIAGMLKERSLRGQQQAVLGQQAGARTSIAQKLAELLQGDPGQGQPMQMPAGGEGG